MYKITIKTASNSYADFLGYNLLQRLGPLMSRYLPSRPVLVLSDRNVSFYYAQKCLRSLQLTGFRPYLEVLEGGEKDKSLAIAADLYTRALEKGLDRHSAIVALGGGVTGDLAGFVAATYLRGVPYVQIPTTLLAMVDSSVGGKVAVNHPMGKNLIGAFYQPVMVLSDLETLKTLPQREFNAGLAELLKYAIIWDESFFLRWESLSCQPLSAGGLLERNSPLLLKFIIKAVLIKGRIVFRDEKEQSLRRILNFGHTFGHALESATDYTYYLHGEAVACGMFMATRLAALLKILDRHSEMRIIKLLKQLPLPLPPPELNLNAVMKALFYDKKKEGEDLIFILPVAPGRVKISKSPASSLCEKVIAEYLHGNYSS